MQSGRFLLLVMRARLTCLSSAHVGLGSWPSCPRHHHETVNEPRPYQAHGFTPRESLPFLSQDEREGPS